MAVGCFNSQSTDVETWERLVREGIVNTGPVEAINAAPYYFANEPTFNPVNIDWLAINKEFAE